MSTALRAQILSDFPTGGIKFRIVLADIDEKGWVRKTIQVLQAEEGTGHLIWHYVTDEERVHATATTYDPSIFTLPEGCGEALLAALATHFHGTNDSAILYQMLKHEQGRRDELEKLLGVLATGLVAKSVTTGSTAWPDQPGPVRLGPI